MISPVGQDGLRVPETHQALMRRSVGGESRRRRRRKPVGSPNVKCHQRIAGLRRDGRRVNPVPWDRVTPRPIIQHGDGGWVAADASGRQPLLAARADRRGP